MAEYIDREMAINLFYTVNTENDGTDGSTEIRKTANYSSEEIESMLSDLPPADAVPVRRARWEECDYFEPCIHGFGTIRYANAGVKCTNCVHSFKKELLWRHNYCPNCGAKMDGGRKCG